MSDKVQTKFREVINWYQSYTRKRYAFNGPADAAEIKKLEKLIGEKLPEDLNDLYSVHDGETDGGTFLGEDFMKISDIIDCINTSIIICEENEEKREKLSLAKPDPKRKEEVIKKILQSYKDLETKREWFKMEFECGASGYSMPCLYLTLEDATNSKWVKTRKEIHYDPIKPLMEELLPLENMSEDGYITFDLFKDGHYSIKDKRDSGDLSSTLSCYPESTIKKIYFHLKWVPLFTDHGGNYIGIDLDPDVKGAKGQVINFGRDETEMVVLAKSLADFFDICIAETKKKDLGEFKNLGKYHLHYILSQIAKASK
ncbi:MAG: SMI1/KNR4 family protein [Bacteroidia bacterium]